MSKDKILYVKDAQKILEEFGKMNKRTKELALATLMGMRMVAESEDYVSGKLELFSFMGQ